MQNWPKELINQNTDGSNRYSDKIASAKSTLKHYFWLAMGERFDADNAVEIEGIVDDLCEGMLEIVKLSLAGAKEEAN